MEIGNLRIGLNRRQMLGAATIGAVGAAANMSRLELLGQPAFADELQKNNKSVLLLWLAGGASQLETWDPKPGRPTGGGRGTYSSSQCRKQLQHGSGRSGDHPLRRRRRSDAQALAPSRPRPRQSDPETLEPHYRRGGREGRVGE